MWWLFVFLFSKWEIKETQYSLYSVLCALGKQGFSTLNLLYNCIDDIDPHFASLVPSEMGRPYCVRAQNNAKSHNSSLDTSPVVPSKGETWSEFAHVNLRCGVGSEGRICTPPSEKDHPASCGGLCFHLGLHMVILRLGHWLGVLMVMVMLRT